MGPISSTWDLTGSIVVWNRVLAMSSAANLMRSWKSLLISFNCCRHGEQDFAELLQALLHLSPRASRGVVALAVEVAGTLGILVSAAGFLAAHNPTRGCMVPDIACSTVYAHHVYQLLWRALTWADVDVWSKTVAGAGFVAVCHSQKT